MIDITKAEKLSCDRKLQNIIVTINKLEADLATKVREFAEQQYHLEEKFRDHLPQDTSPTECPGDHTNAALLEGEVHLHDIKMEGRQSSGLRAADSG